MQPGCRREAKGPDPTLGFRAYWYNLCKAHRMLGMNANEMHRRGKGTAKRTGRLKHDRLLRCLRFCRCGRWKSWSGSS